jgi:hypothetical protein
MATLTVRSSDGQNIGHDVGSGVGFFGAGGFGYSVQVDKWNARTFITNANGTVEGAEIDNLMWTAPTGCIWGTSGEEHLLTEIPNDKATINIRFEHTSAVDVQNVELRAYDGTNVDNAPSGVEIRGFEIIHPDAPYTNNGSGDAYWTAMSGAVGVLSLSDSPGLSGVYAAAGGTGASEIADWSIGLASSPASVGSKTGKFYFTLEYL